jgi:hypothetical protein
MVCDEFSKKLCPLLNSTLEKAAPSRKNISETKTREAFSMAMSEQFSVTSNAASLPACHLFPWSLAIQTSAWSFSKLNASYFYVYSVHID